LYQEVKTGVFCSGKAKECGISILGGIARLQHKHKKIAKLVVGAALGGVLNPATLM
jgi:hypothetical protein